MSVLRKSSSETVCGMDRQARAVRVDSSSCQYSMVDCSSLSLRVELQLLPTGHQYWQELWDSYGFEHLWTFQRARSLPPSGAIKPRMLGHVSNGSWRAFILGFMSSTTRSSKGCD